jgi:hypothetical protein
MVRAHRPHRGLQPKQVYTSLAVRISESGSAAATRISESVSTLQEQMIMGGTRYRSAASSPIPKLALNHLARLDADQLRCIDHISTSPRMSLSVSTLQEQMIMIAPLRQPHRVADASAPQCTYSRYCPRAPNRCILVAPHEAAAGSR